MAPAMVSFGGGRPMTTWWPPKEPPTGSADAPAPALRRRPLLLISRRMNSEKAQALLGGVIDRARLSTIEKVRRFIVATAPMRPTPFFTMPYRQAFPGAWARSKTSSGRKAST